jgi:hypothetical protein
MIELWKLIKSASLSPGFFNLIDNAVLQQSRIKILFRTALSILLF